MHWTATVEKELYRWFFRLVDSWRLGWAWSGSLSWSVRRSLSRMAAVRKTTAPAAGARLHAGPVPPVIGTVDMDAVFKGYEKFKATNKEFQAAVLARQNELMKIKAEGEEEAQMLAKLTPWDGQTSRNTKTA